MTGPIQSIVVATRTPMANHIANGGDKLLGNMSSVKKTESGHAYISGQKQRHALFEALRLENELDPEKGNTHVSMGFGVDTDIRTSLRGDLGGFMHPKGGGIQGKRVAPLSASFAIAEKPSRIFTDLLQRLHDDKDQMTIAQREVSQEDTFLGAFHLNVSMVGTVVANTFVNAVHVDSKSIALIDLNEKRRRIKLALKAIHQMNAYSQAARNLVSGEPVETLIVFDTKHHRKAVRYFQPNTTEEEKAAILKEIEDRGGKYFHGKDGTENSVAAALKAALESLETVELPHPDEVTNWKEANEAAVKAIKSLEKEKKPKKGKEEQNAEEDAA